MLVACLDVVGLGVQHGSEGCLIGGGGYTQTEDGDHQ